MTKEELKTAEERLRALWPLDPYLVPTNYVHDLCVLATAWLYENDTTPAVQEWMDQLVPEKQRELLVNRIIARQPTRGDSRRILRQCDVDFKEAE